MRQARGKGRGVELEALRDLRRARRSRFVEQLDVMEVLYRVYVAGIFGAIALGVLAGAIHEAPLDAAGVSWLRQHGPATLGALVAVAVLLGARTGSHGGPLAIEAAEVQYVLLAPIDRGVALRPAALRQLRVAGIAGAVLGAIVGNFVFRRLPGSAFAWIGSLALFGALLPLCALAAALLTCGRRLHPLAAGAAGLALVAWSAADLALGATSSPATMLGEVAVLPLQSGLSAALAAAGVALAVLLTLAGVLALGGIDLEAARRRAALAAELRFSAAVQDVRAVVLLRRQLASERPRRRPWIRLRGRALERRPVWRRGWQSFLRWPPARVARAIAIAVAAGAAAAAGWGPAPALLALVGPLLLVAALDLIEPLAQEADHPTRRELLPLRPGQLTRRHLAAPASALALLVGLASLAAGVFAGSAVALAIGAVMLGPTALALACCAAFSATNDPYAYILMPQMGYVQSAAPLVVAALVAGVPLLTGRQVARAGHSGVPAVAAFEAALLLASWAMAAALALRMEKRAAAAGARA